MIKTKIQDISWSFVSRGGQLGVQILILPLILRMLSAGELGLWYSFAGIMAFALLTTSVLEGTLARNFTYARAGAETILSCGLSASVQAEMRPNAALCRRILCASAVVYWGLTLVFILILVSAGSFYIGYISKEISGNTKFYAWGLYAAYLLIYFHACRWRMMLTAAGEVAAAQKILMAGEVIKLFSAAAVIFIPGSKLVMLCGTFAVSALFDLICGRMCFCRTVSGYVPAGFSFDGVRGILSEMWHNTWKLSINAAGTFCALNATGLLVAAYCGLDTAGSYGLSLQLASAALTMASVPVLALMPELTALCQLGDMQKLKKLFLRGIWFFVVFAAAAGVFILFAGTPLLEMLGSRGRLLPQGTLALLYLMLMLEKNHALAATVIVAMNKVPFVWTGLINGAVILLLVFWAAACRHAGIFTIVFIQFAVQLGFNNWYWPLYLRREIRRR